MDPLVAITLDTTAILTIVCGAAGLLLSLGLLVAPERIRKVDAVLSRSYHVKEHIAYVDRVVRKTFFVYRHPRLNGALLALGAVVTLVFLLYRMDGDRLLTALGVADDRRLLWGMALEAMVLTGKIAGAAGVVIGLLLMIAPERLQRVECRLNRWIATQPLVDRLDDYHDVVDGFAFRHPVLMGSLGTLLSAILIFLSLTRFF